MKVDILTLHPELVRSPLEHSILSRAQRSGLLEAGVHDIREHGLGKHRTADDTPYGGGAGMVMRVDVVHNALKAVATPDSHVVLMSAAGESFNQAMAQDLAQKKHLVLICGHYEGIDARIERYVDQQICIGDYVLTGGELAALVITDAVVRLVPGVLGNAASTVDESFSQPLLEYPQYTRPREYDGVEVPDVLLSGHHAAIDRWRNEQAVARTRAVRPDLLADGPQDR